MPYGALRINSACSADPCFLPPSHHPCRLERERLGDVRADKEKLRLLSEDLQLKIKASRHETDVISTALRNARHAAK